jgi:hypothetical protein
MYKQLMDKEWLEKMAKSKTDQEIADIVGCTVHGVISARLRFGIKRAERDWRRNGSADSERGIVCNMVSG